MCTFTVMYFSFRVHTTLKLELADPVFGLKTPGLCLKLLETMTETLPDWAVSGTLTVKVDSRAFRYLSLLVWILLC